MSLGSLTRSGLLLFCAFTFSSVLAAQTESVPAAQIPLWQFDELTAPGSCRMMGRFQDKAYCDSKIVDQVLALGKDAIPLLIAELTDERKTKHSVYDLWKFTAAGDIANSLLFDLFTAPDWEVTDLPELAPLEHECSKPGEPCWRKFLHQKGRRFVQQRWEAAWTAHKDEIYWDQKSRCFKVPSSGQLVGHMTSPQASNIRRR